ncbi:MAG: glycosyltransferase family 87 protein [Terriglobales bacterium]
MFLLAVTLSNLVTAFKLAPQLRNGYQNFTMFYAAARMVRSGQSAALYDLSATSRAQQEFAPNVRIRQAALPYMHPPFEALLFVPFTFLPYVPAYLLWNFLNGMLVLASLVLLRRQFAEIGNLPFAFLVLAATGFLPVASGIIQGQDSNLLLFLLVVALTAAERGNDAAAGAALAAGLFKFNLVLPFVFLLATKRPRLLLGFAPVAALLGGISLAMVGWQGAVGYVQYLFRLENTGAGGALVGAAMPNLRGMLASLAGAHNGASLMPLTIACSAVVVAIAMWRIAAIRDSVRRVFVLATAAAILVSYHTFSYDLSLLLPAALLLFAAPDPESRRPSQADVVLLVLFYVAPLFEPFWPHVNQVGWPVVILVWFFWKLGRDGTPESGAAS